MASYKNDSVAVIKMCPEFLKYVGEIIKTWLWMIQEPNIKILTKEYIIIRQEWSFARTCVNGCESSVAPYKLPGR